MLGQPSEVIAIDFWTLVPNILKRVKSNRASGQFVVRDGTIVLASRRLKSTAAGSYYAEFYSPSDERDFATGTLVLCYEEWGLPKLILLVGQPSGFGEYQWRGVSPTTLRPAQMLYLDPATQLFVSREAVGKPPPVSVQRINDDRVVLAKLIEKYGLSGQPHSDLKEDPDFAPFEGLIHIIADALFASNGLPSPVLTGSGATNVLATIQNSKSRQRLPARLLKKNSARKLPPSFRSVEQVRAEFRRRRLPDPGQDFFDALESRFSGS